FTQEDFQVTVDRKVDRKQRLGQFSGIDVDADLEGVRRECFPVIADLPDVESRAKHEQQIGVLHNEVRRALPEDPRPPAIQWVASGYRVVSARWGNCHSQ